ncbi:hypothetical protein BT96DRAFT_837520 [Gymnopus androsaceus JB14]|uniref:Uncharacterized protein n=1 Tax=Gymnopus androsaceus JB14 TaxID=1447944 RepID=A0A6A4GP04_9AGAR|nr:hypothetical protein BT96DRAFT_837520 [Gymnopus androsaceus JB14]
MSILSALPSPQSPLHTEALNNFSSDSIEPFTHIQALGLEKVSKEPPPSIDPITSLELRLRLLESLIVGLDPDEKGKLELKNDTLVKSAENVKRTVDKYVEGNDTLKRFIAHYDQYERYLTPAFSLGLLEEPSYENLSSFDLAAYLHDMEPEIRSADTDMQEIEALLRKGAAEAGKLPNHVDLEPRLAALRKSQQENKERANALERRVADIIENHTTYIDALSELFVEWDDALTNAESRVGKMERDKEERKRLGLE